MDSSMFDGFGKGLIIGGIVLFVAGSFTGIVIYKLAVYVIAHLDLTWK